MPGKIKNILRKIAIVFLVGIAWIILLDVGLRIIFFAYDSIEKHKQVVLEKEQAKRNSEIQKQLFGEQSAIALEEVLEEQRKAHNWRFYPFFMWRNKEFSGRYLHISADGIRSTWNPPSESGRVKKIFCLGGSTMWGTGARDDYTIPSLLSRELYSQGYRNYRVYNFGEEAYTSTQELVYLILKLRDGEIPDYVIFYDGANDIFSLVQPGGEVGTIHGLEDIRNKFEKKEISDIQMFNRGLNALLEDKSGVIRVIKIIRNKIKELNRAKKNSEVAIGRNQRIQSLSAQIIDKYFADIALVDNLSKSYGFKYTFFWQPSLYCYKPLTTHEEWLSTLKGEECVQFYKIVHADINARKNLPRHFVNLDKIFSHKYETIYLDLCHITEKENAMVAKKIFSVIKNGLSLE